MKLMIRYLLENNVKEEQIIQINFESIEFKKMTVEILYDYVKNNLPKNKKLIYFLMKYKKSQNGKMQ